MVLQIKLVIDVVGFSYNAIVGCGFFISQTATAYVSFFVTRGGVVTSAAVIMSIINCVEPSYEPDEDMIARLLPSPEFEKSGSRRRLTYTEPC